MKLKNPLYFGKEPLNSLNIQKFKINLSYFKEQRKMSIKHENN